MATMIMDTEKQAIGLHAAIATQDVEKVLSFYTDDIFMEQVIGDGVIIHGKEEARLFLTQLFAAFPDFRMELGSCIASGDWACYLWVMSGTHRGDYMGIPGTGKSFSIRGNTVAKLREGKNSQLFLYYDSASFLRQLGALPPADKK